MRARQIWAAVCASCLIFGAGLTLGKKKASTGIQERFAATLVPPLNEPRPRAVGDTADSALSLTIEGHTTDEEMKGLSQTFAEDGQGAMDKALGKSKKGYFTMGVGQTMPLVIVQSRSEGTSRKLQMVGKAPGTFRSPDGTTISNLPHNGFPYTFIQLDVDEQGNGKGMLVPFGNFGFDNRGHMVIKPMFRSGNSLVNVHSEK